MERKSKIGRSKVQILIDFKELTLK